jgi:hypothetical protein
MKIGEYKIEKLLNDYAKRLGDLRDDLLFDEPDIRDSFDRSKGATVQFFLAGLAQLEMAERMMKLAALQYKEEEQ